MELLYKNLERQSQKLLGLHQKVKLEKVTRKELSESTPYKLIQSFQLNTNTENFLLDQAHHLHHFIVHLQENSLNKTWKTGKSLPAFQTGKTQEVIQFQFI
jgi:hypothetical protein